MQTLDDMALVREYAANQSEGAFETLVARHVNLVYSAAMRQTGDPHLAEEVTQAVFLVLARKAGGLRPETLLTGWLFQTTRYAAAAERRARIRRQRHEMEAQLESANLTQPPEETVWPQLAPLLDEALAGLGETDRRAVLLRYFEGRSLAEVGATLALNEEAARKRVTRGLEKLRKYFVKRGVKITAPAIAGAMAAHSVQAAPTGLANTISAVALAKGATAGGSTLALAKGALKLMAWTKAKMAVGVAVGMLLAAGTTTVVVEKAISDLGTDHYFLEMKSPEELTKMPPKYCFVRPTHFKSVMTNPTWAMGINDQAIGRSSDFQTMLEYAYDFHVSTRTVLPDGPLPAGGFDFLTTVPGGLENFQAQIRSQFGYTARKEVRGTDVLVLKVRRTDAPGLRPSADARPNPPSPPGTIKWANSTIQRLATDLEYYENQPVIDETRLKGAYDIQLDWQPDWAPNGDKGATKITEASRAKLRTAVLEQLGLDLVPTNQPVEMFVVEKVGAKK